MSLVGAMYRVSLWKTRKGTPLENEEKRGGNWWEGDESRLWETKARCDTRMMDGNSVGSFLCISGLEIGGFFFFGTTR